MGSGESTQKNEALMAILFLLAASNMIFQQVNANETVIKVPDNFPSINGAIQNASDGDIILVRQGIYNETIVIDKTITIRGEDTNNTIINGNNNGTVIQILHDNVTITGLTVTYSTTPNTPRRYYQHNLPQDWLSATYRGWSAIGYPLDGGYFVRATEFRLYGIHVENAKNCHISGNKISDCGVGIWLWQASQNNITGNILIRNDYGLQIESSKNNCIIGNTFSNNGGGIWLPQPNWVSGWGIDAKTTNNTFTKNNFIDNQKAIEPQCLTNTTSSWDSGAVGNYWHLYNDTDDNQDGVGDVPYQIIGEYFTGGYHLHGIWTEQVYGVDNFPLMKPFDTASMFAVYRASVPSHQPTSAAAIGSQFIALIAAILFVALVALAVYLKKRRRQHRNQDRYFTK